MVSWASSESTGKASDTFLSSALLFCCEDSGFNSQPDRKEIRHTNKAKTGNLLLLSGILIVRFNDRSKPNLRQLIRKTKEIKLVSGNSNE
jgi:hypothetical protein